MTEFPSSLPCFRQEDNSYYLFNTILDNELNSKRTRSQINKTQVRYQNIGLKINSNDLEIFDAWRESINYIEYFLAWVITPEGYTQKKFRFINTEETRKYYVNGEYWILNFVLESPKQAYLSEDELELIIAFGMPLDELPAFFNEFENIANADFYGVLP